MINLELVEYFPKGISPEKITYYQEPTINLPVEGSATIDVFEGETKREVALPLTVNHVQTTESISASYTGERQRRRSPDFRYPNALIANLSEFELDASGVLIWRENLTDFSVLNGVLRKGLLYTLPDNERKRISRQLAPTAPGAIVESRDGNIVVGVKGGKTYLEGNVNIFPVGHPRFNINRNPDRNYLEDPFQALSRQAITEMNLPLYVGMNDSNQTAVFGAVRGMHLIGAVRGNHGNYGSWNPLVLFAVESKWDTKQLREGYEIASDKYEHERFVPLPIDAKQLSDFVRGNHPQYPFNNLIDNGVGAFLLYGRFRFGDSWYENLVHDLITNARYETTITEGNPFKSQI